MRRDHLWEETLYCYINLVLFCILFYAINSRKENQRHKKMALRVLQSEGYFIGCLEVLKVRYNELTAR